MPSRQLKAAVICALAFASLPAPPAYAGQFTQPVPPAITSYFAGGVEYVIYVDANGILWSLSFNTITHVGWTRTQLTAEGQYAPGSPLLAYADNHGTGWLYFYVWNYDLNGNVDIFELNGNPPTQNYNDITYLSGQTYWPQAVNSAAYGNAKFVDSNNNAFGASLFYPSNLVGFADSYGTHHVFYFGGPNPPSSGNPSNLLELYSSDSGGANWTNHSIASISNTAGNVPIGLTALWDGSVQHIYWNPSPTALVETYNNGQWWTHTMTQSNNPPYYNVAAMSPKTGWQWLFGSNSAVSQGTNAVEWWNSGSWSSATIGAGGFFLWNGIASFAWKDNTSGLGGSGTDGGFFYTDSSLNVNIDIPGVANAVLSYGTVTGHTQYTPAANQITGFSEGLSLGNYLHVFWIDGSGNIWEAYAASNSIGPGFGTWHTHTIGSGAAH